jgi:cyclase
MAGELLEARSTNGPRRAFKQSLPSSERKSRERFVGTGDNVHRTLIVARMNAANAGDVASAFAESDTTELPHLIGAAHRTLFHFKGLYFHLVDADEDITPNLGKARNHPLYLELNQRLSQYVSAFDPQTWREPKDAMATPFYTWSAS